MRQKYKAMVLSCIDPRFQPKVYVYLDSRKLQGNYSSFTIAGAAVGVTHDKYKKWQKTFFDNLSTSIKLHKINRLIVINHKDCGAAKLVNGKKKRVIPTQKFQSFSIKKHSQIEVMDWKFYVKPTEVSI